MAGIHDWYRWEGVDLRLQLQVQPRSSKDAFGPIHNGRLKLHLTSPPVDGKANQDLCTYLAKQFRMPKSAVTISHGESSRLKTVLLQKPGQIPPDLEIGPSPGKE